MKWQVYGVQTCHRLLSTYQIDFEVLSGPWDYANESIFISLWIVDLADNMKSYIKKSIPLFLFEISRNPYFDRFLILN